ncbi:hypothetical protein, partial [Escherichia coli]
ISHRQKQKKLIMLPSETMIWQPEFTDKTLSRKPGAVHFLFHYGYPRTTSTNNKRHITATLHTDSAKINAAFVI